MGDIRELIPEFGQSHLLSLARLIAQSTEQVSEEQPLLSATLPAGYRVQIVIPPACEQTHLFFQLENSLL